MKISVPAFLYLLFSAFGVFSQDEIKLQNLWNHQGTGRNKVLAITKDSIEVRITDSGKGGIRSIKPYTIASQTEITGGIRLAVKQDSSDIVSYKVFDFKGLNKDSVFVIEYPFSFDTQEQCGKLSTGLSEFPPLTYHTTEYLNYRKQGEKAAPLKKEELLGLLKTISDELRDSTAKIAAKQIHGLTTDERLTNYCLVRIKKDPFAKKIYPQNFSAAFKKYKEDPAVQKQLIPLRSVFFVKPSGAKGTAGDSKKTNPAGNKKQKP